MNHKLATEVSSRKRQFPTNRMGLLPKPSTQILATTINFLKTPLPEYNNHLALILDNVLSPAECTNLLARAQAAHQWEIAQINTGGNNQVLNTGYRNSSRILLDDQGIARWLLDRCRPYIGEFEEWKGGFGGMRNDERGKRLMR